MKLKFCIFWIEDSGTHDIGRHQVRCELNAHELCIDGPGEQFCGECLGNPRYAFQ